MENERLRTAGRNAYQRYQRNLKDGKLKDVLWHDYVHRGIRFFLADTRTEREPRVAAADPYQARLIGPRQAEDIERWLKLDLERPAFIVSPSMLLPRRRGSTRDAAAALRSDAWCGYPQSLNNMLALIWRLKRSNVVFLSGDEHLSCVVEATVTDAQEKRSVRLLSIHSSGLYAPFPFANAIPESFALPDEWHFSHFDAPEQPGLSLHCSVRLYGSWAPGDGFAMIGLTPPVAASRSAPWHLQVAFNRAPCAERAQPQPLLFALSG